MTFCLRPLAQLHRNPLAALSGLYRRFGGGFDTPNKSLKRDGFCGTQQKWERTTRDCRDFSHEESNQNKINYSNCLQSFHTLGTIPPVELFLEKKSHFMIFYSFVWGKVKIMGDFFVSKSTPFRIQGMDFIVHKKSFFGDETQNQTLYN